LENETTKEKHHPEKRMGERKKERGQTRHTV